MKKTFYALNVRALALTLCVALALSFAAGCGDKEPEQRKTFIEILHKNVLDQPGTRILLLTDDEKKALGPYEAHFTVLVDILDRDRAAQEPTNKLQRLANGVLRCNNGEACLKALDELDVALKETGAMLQAGVDKAKADKAALQQPEDLKIVFDQAFERLFASEELALEAHSYLVEISASARSINEFILANPDKVTYKGGNIMILDASIESKVQDMLNTQVEMANKLNDLQRRLNEILNKR